MNICQNFMKNWQHKCCFVLSFEFILLLRSCHDGFFCNFDYHASIVVCYFYFDRVPYLQPRSGQTTDTGVEEASAERLACALALLALALRLWRPSGERTIPHPSPSRPPPLSGVESDPRPFLPSVSSSPRLPLPLCLLSFHLFGDFSNSSISFSDFFSRVFSSMYFQNTIYVVAK